MTTLLWAIISVFIEGFPHLLVLLGLGSGILSLGLGCFIKQLPFWAETVGGLSLIPAVMVSPPIPLCSGTDVWERRVTTGGSKGSEFYEDW